MAISHEEPNYTFLISSRIKYSNLRKNRHTAAVVEEFTHHQDPPTTKDIRNWRKLLERLKKMKITKVLSNQQLIMKYFCGGMKSES